MIEKIKELRVRIDGLSQLVKGLNCTFNLRLIPDEKLDEIKFKEAFEGMKRGDFQFVQNDISPQITNLGNNEINKCYDSLILAKAWLGKILGELGEQTPYANDGSRKDIKDIEPAADKVNFNSDKIEFMFGTALTHGKSYYDFNHIEKVDWLREQIKDIIINTEDFSKDIDFIQLEQGFVYKHLCEARFWLGFELGRIRDASSN